MWLSEQLAIYDRGDGVKNGVTTKPEKWLVLYVYGLIIELLIKNINNQSLKRLKVEMNCVQFLNYMPLIQLSLSYMHNT